MKVTPNNFVFIPLKVKDIKVLKDLFVYLSCGSKEFDFMFDSDFFATYFANLLKMLDIY